MSRSLVIHVPHSSTDIPNAYIDQFCLGSVDLAREAYISADLHTDRLARTCWPNATIVEAEVSRIVVDVERYEDDAEEVMAAVGRGAIYTRTHAGEPLRRELGVSERRYLLEIHRRHWQRLRLAANGQILIDLHTYPVAAWPVEPVPNAHRPEIDIGVSKGITPCSWIKELVEHFGASGFEVGINTPYVGVVDAGAAAAVMIEIRRDVIGVPGNKAWARITHCLSAMPVFSPSPTVSQTEWASCS